jgi:predicted small secreted protein
MNKIQYLLLSMVLITVSGCGTMGGAVSGAGQDLSRAGEWIRSR